MKFVTSFLLSLSIFCLHAQIKTLIPIDEEVNLPNNDESKIGLSTTLDETVIHKDKIVKLFSNHIVNTMNTEFYHLLDSGKNYIELFVVYPCKGFNVKDIQDHQIINEGIITSTILIKFNTSTYDIHLKDYYWVNKDKKGTSIDEIYKVYRKNDDLVYKLKYYGILKSCEYSIAESLSNIMAVIDEVMKGKG
ncbi:MAG: hypothetical protein ACK5UE_00745 [Chitinophagales bacterium]|nr:hypothetical protein [Sphingobacteriales bacterium]